MVTFSRVSPPSLHYLLMNDWHVGIVMNFLAETKKTEAQDQFLAIKRKTLKISASLKIITAAEHYSTSNIGVCRTNHGSIKLWIPLTLFVALAEGKTGHMRTAFKVFHGRRKPSRFRESAVVIVKDNVLPTSRCDQHVPHHWQRQGGECLDRLHNRVGLFKPSINIV